jgi:hypothetical protein
MRIKANDKKIPNKFHFGIQVKYHANVFKNRKVYTRKQKHKSIED